MSKKHDKQSDDAPTEQEQADPAGARAEGDAQQPTLDQRMAQLESEKQELEDKLLRMSADYQNFARRAQRDAQAARAHQVVEVAKQLVGVIDNFDRALEVDPETVTAKDLLDGVGLVHEEFMRALGKVGIERMDVRPGQPMDPNRHEALMHQPSDEVEPNHVLAQLQPGYVLHGDKVIRPAKVSVASAPPPEAPPEASAETPSEEAPEPGPDATPEA